MHIVTVTEYRLYREMNIDHAGNNDISVAL